MSPRKMFVQLIWRAALRRRGATLLALVSITVAATVATALLGLYVDIESKLSKEFRGFGASLIVVAKEDESFSSEAVSSVRTQLPAATVVPVAYAAARTQSGKPLVVVGTELDAAKKLNPYWAVAGDGTSLAGERALQALESEDSKQLIFNGKRFSAHSFAKLKTGGDEDSRIYIPLEEFSAWTGLAASTLEVGVPGGTREIETASARLSQLLTTSEVRPLRQVAEAEARVLGRTRAVFLGCMATIVVVVGLCVFATLTASVFERRKDYAVMKALGSTQRGLNALFLAESGALGLVGALMGFVLGTGLAAIIGRVNFHANVSPRLEVLPQIIAGSLLLTVAAALFPLVRLQNLAPATMLKGD